MVVGVVGEVRVAVAVVGVQWSSSWPTVVAAASSGSGCVVVVVVGRNS